MRQNTKWLPQTFIAKSDLDLCQFWKLVETRKKKTFTQFNKKAHPRNPITETENGLMELKWPMHFISVSKDTPISSAENMTIDAY